MFSLAVFHDSLPALKTINYSLRHVVLRIFSTGNQFWNTALVPLFIIIIILLFL